MSRHEGVSCDSCLKGNFRGRRYKCLVCYDYDLCSTCYEAGSTSTRHTADHAMQCILTRTDLDLFYGGEAVTTDSPQAVTCPYCGKMGFTEATLQEHVTSEHTETSSEVVCPVCAALPGGDPNHVTDDFAAHLALEHRAPRDLDEPAGIRHTRRIPMGHPAVGHSTRGGSRARRSNMHFSTTGSSLTGSTLTSVAISNRDTMDPIAELLSQLSGVRRAVLAGSPQQISELQRQLQTERQIGTSSLRVFRPGQQLERLPSRRAESKSKTASASSSASQQTQRDILASAIAATSNPQSGASSSKPQFLLPKYSSRNEDNLLEKEIEADDRDCADHSLFIQEVLLSTLTEQLHLDTTTVHERARAVSPCILEQAPNIEGAAASNTSGSTYVPAPETPGDENNSSNDETLRDVVSKHLHDEDGEPPPPFPKSSSENV